MKINGILIAAVALTGICCPLKASEYEIALEGVGTTDSFHEGFASFYGNNRKYGAIDASGRVAIEPRFEHSFYFAGGMAVVETETGKGVINRQGYFLLEPKYEYISREDESPYLFSVRDSVGQKTFFYNNRLVAPFTYSFCSSYNFPFLEIGDKQYNVVTGETFSSISENGGVFTARDAYGNIKYFDKTGSLIDAEKYAKSSKGLRVFRDTVNAFCGLKDAATSEVVVPAKYVFKNDIWINDRLYYTAEKDSEGNLAFKSGVLDASGRVIASGNFDSFWEVSGFLYGYSMNDSSALFSMDGEIILPNRYKISHIKDAWFNIKNAGKEQVFNAKTRKFYDGSASYEIKDGMLRVYTGDYYYFINAETGERVKGKYEYANLFSEGLAVVRIGDDDKSVIDKRGKAVFKDTEEFEIEGSGFSEGVLGVRINGYPCYIYNPLGHGGYVYNQEVFSDETIRRWWKQAGEYYEDGDFAQAKELYYRIMMDNPSNVDAIINYGSSLEHLGNYDDAIRAFEMALELDSGNELAQNNLSITKNNKAAAEQSQEPEDNGSDSVWDALSNFGNMLSQMAASYAGGGYGGSSYGGGYSSGGSYGGGYSSGGSSSGGKSASYYQSQYNRWENVAKRHYNSITTTGYRAKSKSGDRHGSTMSGMSGGNYTMQKKSLREAQREMRKIRQEASRNGITISQSKWETATVSY